VYEILLWRSGVATLWHVTPVATHELICLDLSYGDRTVYWQRMPGAAVRVFVDAEPLLANVFWL